MKSFTHPNPRHLWPLLWVAITVPVLLPGAPGAVIAMVALSATLLMFVRARALRGWLVVALLAALLAAAALG